MPTVRPPAPSRALLVALLSTGLAWGWYVHFWPHFHTANESIRLYFVQAVVDHGRPELDDVVRAHGVIPVDRSEVLGHVYMDKAPGASLLALPLYPLLKVVHPAVIHKDLWLFGWLATLWAIALPLLGSLVLLARWVRSVGGNDRDAALLTLALALASPLFVYATLFFGHGLATACITAGLFTIAMRPSEDLGRRRGLLAGLALGFGGLTDTPVFVLAALVCLWTVVRASGPWLQRLRLGLPTLLGVAICALLQLLYNTWVLGHPLHFTYQYKGDPGLARIMATGFLGFRPPQGDALLGLLFSARRGLFYHAPWLVAGALGLLLHARRSDLPRRQRIDSAGMLASAVAYILLVSGFADWPAGDCVGARHLLPIVPLLAAGLVHLWRWPTLPRLGRATVAATIGVGMLAAVPVVATFPYHFAQLDRPVLEMSWPLLVQGFFAPSVGRWLGLSEWLSLGVFAALVALPWLLRRRLPDDPRPQAHGRHGRLKESLVALVLIAAWSIAVMSQVPRAGRKVEVLRFRAQSLLGPDADERAGKKAWQQPPRDEPLVNP
jgi:hypothetical protein